MTDTGVSKIRRAVPADIVGMALLCVQYRKESEAFSKYTVDIEVIIENLVYSFEHDDGDILLVYHDDGSDIEGMFWASRVPLLWCKESVYVDNVLYVSEHLRGSRIATDLIKEYQVIAKSTGVDYVKLSSISGLGTKKISKFYTKLGFDKTGVIHFKEI